MYAGYLTFAGTELANAARTKAYVDNFLPSFGLEECYDAENLMCLLGEGAYQSPALDEAPWYSPARPASSKFYGFYPLVVDGIENSTMGSIITELTGDGGVSSRQRAASREIRVSGLLIGQDDEGVNEGMTWLRGLLNGSNCADGNCAGDTFCYLAYAPQCCDYSDYPEAPADDASYINDPGEWFPYRKGEVTPLANGIQVDMPCGEDGAQYRVSRLIPGQPYRVELDLETSDEVRVEVVGGTSITSKPAIAHHPSPRTPWVMDFMATDENATILVVNAGNECDDSTGTIFGLRVFRIPSQVTIRMPRFTPTDTTELGMWSFDDTPAFFNTSVTLDPAADGSEALRFRYTNNSGFDQFLPTTALIQRNIRGLVPGEVYTIYVQAAYTGSPAMDLTIDAPTVGTEDLGDGWMAITFRAAHSKATLSIHTAASVSVLNGANLDMTIHHMRVDVSLVHGFRSLPVPDQTEFAQRTLYGVVRLEGPAVTQRFTKEMTGSMVRVDFILNATHPFIYGAERSAWIDPSSISYALSQVACVNGFPIRRNYFTDPDFGGQTIGDNPSGGIGTYTTLSFNPANVESKVQGPGTHFSTKSIYIKPLSATSANTYIAIPYTGVLEVGHTYTLSADFALSAPMTAGAVSTNARRIVVIDNDATYRSEQLPNVAGGARLSVTFMHMGGTAQLRIYNGDVAGGTDLHISNIQFEESPSMTAPFNGNSDDASWFGTPHQSSSIWEKSGALTITDPDCDPIPLPPQPPNIDLECPIVVDDWLRTVQPIPADMSGGWTSSAPVVTVTTGRQLIRDLRVRFYADPFNRGIEALNPCDYCGEFFVSYIPKDAELTIDSILRQVTANIAGSGVQQAMNLVSNIDGGPIEWPLLTCDIPYVMTIDIAPTEAVDLSVQLTLARRE